MRKNYLVALMLIVAASMWVMGADEAKVPAAAPSADAAKQMEMMMKLAMPGPEHEKLKMMAGKFKADVSMRQAPDVPEQKSQGSSDNEIIMGGRYLRMNYSGDFMGAPFTGVGYIGFDNMKKKYVSTWLDSMSTNIMVSEGTADESGKVITQKCDMDCPMQPGTKMHMRMVTTLIDENNHKYEMFNTGPDGKEFNCMTINYTRQK